MAPDRKDSILRWLPVIIMILSLLGYIVTLGRTMEKFDNMDKRTATLEAWKDKEDERLRIHENEQIRTEEQYKALVKMLEDVKMGQKELGSEIRKTHPYYFGSKGKE